LETILRNNPVFETLQQTELISSFLQSAYQVGLPIAFWKLPNASNFHIAVSFSNNASIDKPNIEELPQGFIVAPFDTTRKPYFIKADLLYSSAERFPKEAFNATIYGSEAAKKRNKFWNIWEAELNAKQKSQERYHHKKSVKTQAEQSIYEALVEKGIQKITDGHYQKVVYARNKAVSKPDDLHLGRTFKRLCEQFSSAFVSMVSLPEEGTWLGASPETLIEIKDKQFFRTVSLAGTQPKHLFNKVSEASWRQKEIEEQALVSRYIINCFKKIRLREFAEVGPKTVAAGNLLHLKTDFLVDMEAVNFPQLGSVMLKLLHPTSAVCGMPRKETMQDIIEHEGYDRQLYSGYLGPVNVNGNTDIFVNLRCMQVTDKELIFYAGAGITEDSEPEKEFLETEMKMDVMRKSVLGDG